MNHTTRTFVLKRMLNDRRQEVLNDARSRVYHAPRGRARDVGGAFEAADASTLGDAELPLVQAGLRSVARLDDALARLDGGKYGSCLECAREISERRLSAVPFAVRCQTCEERRQRQLGPTQALEQESHRSPPMADVCPRAEESLQALD